MNSALSDKYKPAMLKKLTTSERAALMGLRLKTSPIPPANASTVKIQKRVL